MKSKLSILILVTMITSLFVFNSSFARKLTTLKLPHFCYHTGGLATNGKPTRLPFNKNCRKGDIINMVIIDDSKRGQQNNYAHKHIRVFCDFRQQIVVTRGRVRGARSAHAYISCVYIGYQRKRRKRR